MGRFAVALVGAAVVSVPIVAAILLRPGFGAASSAAAAAVAAPSSSAPSVKAAAGPRFPAPPRGAVVFSRELGSDDLALGVVPGHGSVLVQASVVGPQGSGVSGLDVTFAVKGKVRNAAACGQGCYRATIPVTGRPASVEVRVRGGEATRWGVALPSSWPPPDGSALVARAGATWRSLRSLSFSERLASGPGQVVVSAWRVQAPDRVAYRVRGGWSGTIVGDRRWDLSPGSAHWVSSAQSRLTQPVPEWVSVADAHVLGSTTLGGRPVWQVSFFDPGVPAWFDVLIDKSTMRSLKVRMVATAHFMQDDYHSFNTTAAILHPR